MPVKKTLAPLPVRRSLKKFGHDIKSARLRRNIPMALLAERAGISLGTLDAIQKGSASVSIGAYAAVLFGLGFGLPLENLVDIRNDTLGLSIDEENLPQRIRKS